MAQYRNMYVDLSWILTRNLSMVTKNKKPEEMEYGEILRLTIQTIRKIGRDSGILADKIILVFDHWKEELQGYYRTKYLRDAGVAFKKSRAYYGEEELEKIKNDPSATPEMIAKIEYEVAKTKVKYLAKDAMFNDFPKIGLYTYRKEGYEFDDIVSTASLMRGQTYKLGEKKDIIVATDSDVRYSLSPGCDLFKPKIGNNSPEKLFTYEEMCKEIPQSLVDRGVNLYYYHAFRDCLGYGHNDLVNSRKQYADFEQTVLKLLDNDFSNIKPDMIDLFKAEYATFNISTFPEFDQLQKDIAELFNTKGKIGSLDDFHSICKKHGIKNISDSYYLDFTSTLDERYYCEL